jgi:hypothetical protein
MAWINAKEPISLIISDLFCLDFSEILKDAIYMKDSANILEIEVRKLRSEDGYFA